MDIQPLVLEEGVKQGSYEDWDLLYSKFIKAKNPSLKIMILTALSATNDLRLIYR